MLGFEPNKSWLGANMYKDGEDSVERTRNRSMKIRRRAMRFKSGQKSLWFEVKPETVSIK